MIRRMNKRARPRSPLVDPFPNLGLVPFLSFSVFILFVFVLPNPSLPILNLHSCLLYLANFPIYSFSSPLSFFSLLLCRAALPSFAAFDSCY